MDRAAVLHPPVVPAGEQHPVRDQRSPDRDAALVATGPRLSDRRRRASAGRRRKVPPSQAGSTTVLRPTLSIRCRSGVGDRRRSDEADLEGQVADLRMVLRERTPTNFGLVAEQRDRHDHADEPSRSGRPSSCASRSNSMSAWLPLRISWSTKKTASHGPIQYAMISRKFSYLSMSFSPIAATMKPAMPKTTAAISAPSRELQRDLDPERRERHRRRSRC